MITFITTYYLYYIIFATISGFMLLYLEYISSDYYSVTIWEILKCVLIGYIPLVNVYLSIVGIFYMLSNMKFWKIFNIVVLPCRYDIQKQAEAEKKTG